MTTDRANGLRLWELRPNGCRWPLGGTWEHAEFFCGAPRLPGCSYCKEHRKLAFSRAVLAPASKKPISFKDGR